MKAIAFREGLISIAYDREKYKEWARVYMFAKVHMFDADSRMVSGRSKFPKQNNELTMMGVLAQLRLCVPFP